MLNNPPLRLQRLNKSKPFSAVINVPGTGRRTDIHVGHFAAAEEAARAYDAEVVRRGWDTFKPLNFLRADAAAAAAAHPVPGQHLAAPLATDEARAPQLLPHLRTAIAGARNPIVAHRITTQFQAGVLLRTSSRTTLNRRTESARVYARSPGR